MAEKIKVKALYQDERIVCEDSNEARELYDKNRFGAKPGGKNVYLGIVETLYLVEKERLELFGGRGKEITFDNLLKKTKKKEKDIWIRYVVYRDLRDRGYIVKTALKFGAEFRVYDRGIKPGEDHAKWIVYPVFERHSLTWYEFSAKNRVAHSTKKRLMIGVVDEEGDVSYWEVKWTRP